MSDKNPNITTTTEIHDDCKIQNEETKDDNTSHGQNNKEKSTGSISDGGSRQISSISLKMISDCVNLVVDQSHIQLSSVIHISKKDNQLNIEHKMMESTTIARDENSSDSMEETILNRSSFFNNVASGSTTMKPTNNVDIHHEHVIIHQPTSSTYTQSPHQLNNLTSSVNTGSSGPGTSSGSASADNRGGLNRGLEKVIVNQPPPYTKHSAHTGSHKRQTARQMFNQLNDISSNYQMPSGPHQSRQGQNSSALNSLSTCPHLFHHGVLGIPPLQGAPPTYSTVMHIGIPSNRTDPNDLNRQSHTNNRLFNSLFRRPEVCLQPSPPFIAPPRPPPSYAEVHGVSVVRTPIELALEQDIHWGPAPLSVHCPNCGNIVMTVVRLHRSNLTHFSALTLCLCGCWPCCLLPYCMKACKTTYHECPICFTVIGVFTPW